MKFTSMAAKYFDTRKSIMGQVKFYPDRKFPFCDLYGSNALILNSARPKGVRNVVIWERCAPI